MSRMRTDLKPAIRSLNKQASSKSLPPVKSPRRTPEIGWETDMVQYLQVRAMSSKNPRRLLTSPKEPSVSAREQKTTSPPQHSKILQEENMKLKNEVEVQIVFFLTKSPQLYTSPGIISAIFEEI